MRCVDAIFFLKATQIRKELVKRFRDRRGAIAANSAWLRTSLHHWQGMSSAHDPASVPRGCTGGTMSHSPSGTTASIAIAAMTKKAIFGDWRRDPAVPRTPPRPAWRSLWCANRTPLSCSLPGHVARIDHGQRNIEIASLAERHGIRQIAGARSAEGELSPGRVPKPMG